MQQHLKWRKHMQLQPFAYNFFYFGRLVITLCEDLILRQVKFYSRHRLLTSYRKKKKKKKKMTDFCYFYVISLSSLAETYSAVTVKSDNGVKDVH